MLIDIYLTFLLTKCKNHILIKQANTNTPNEIKTIVVTLMLRQKRDINVYFMKYISRTESAK